MRICIITQPAAWGGTETHTVALTNLLTARGHDITLITIGQALYTDVQFCQNEAVRRFHWNQPSGWILNRIGYWSGLLERLPREVCLLVKGCFGAGSLALDIALRRHFRRFFTIEHLVAPNWPRPRFGRHTGGWLPGLGVRWYLRLPYALLRNRVNQRFICVSKAVRERLVQTYLCPRSKTTVIHNAIDTEKFRHSGENRRKLWKEWNINGECQVVFGSMGRLNRVKGFDIAIVAVAELAKRIPRNKFQFVLIGDGPERAQLTKLAVDRGCRDLVIFRPSTAVPWEAYSGMDFFVMPSREEGLPLTLLEAMATECIPIATKVGGIPEVINDPALGRLIEPESTEQLADSMASAFHSSAQEKLDCGRRARSHVEKNFDIREWEKGFVQLVERET